MRTDYTKASKKNDKPIENNVIKDSENEVKPQKKKMFISLPMSGRTDEDVLNEMNYIGNKFKERYDIIDTYHQEDDPYGESNRSGVWYLGHSIQLLRTADIVVFAKDWTTARGCIIEHRVCELYDIPYIEMI